jgi:hypothetical protein
MGKKKRIVVQPDGPYQVEGEIPLVRKTQVVSAYGERLTWRRDEWIETQCAMTDPPERTARMRLSLHPQL